jgi:hypothetical protein
MDVEMSPQNTGLALHHAGFCINAHNKVTCNDMWLCLCLSLSCLHVLLLVSVPAVSCRPHSRSPPGGCC